MRASVGGAADEFQPDAQLSFAPLDPTSHPQYFCTPMKTAARKPNRRVAEKPRPRMTRELAEARAVGGGKGRFDGVAFLRTLKK